MIAQTMTCGYTGLVRKKKRAGIGVLNLKADNRHQRGFFMSVCLLLWADCTGCSNARRDLESGTPTCTALPTPIGVEVASGKTISRRHVMSNQSIATSVALTVSQLRLLTDGSFWRYPENLSQAKAVTPPRQSAAFFMPACRQSYPSLVGVENSHTTPARGKLYAASLAPRVRPTARIVGGFSLKSKGGQNG